MLKREPNHFVLLTVVVPARPPQTAGMITGKKLGSGGDEDGRERSSGDAVSVPAAAIAMGGAGGACGGGGTGASKRGVSCFRRSELPDVVRKLWKI